MAPDHDCLLELAEQLGELGHWRLSQPDNAMTWSRETCRIHGLMPNNVSPALETMLEVYHPQDRHVLATAIASAIHDRAQFDCSLRLMRPDGEMRYVRNRGLPIIGTGNRTAAIFGIVADVTDLRRMAEFHRQSNLKLEQMAYVDALTHLANRRQFDEVLEREWRRAVREQTPLSLVLMDIDFFKKYNDLYGHIAGDDCLRAVAATTAQAARRPGDLAARYGGEEFAVILPVTETAGAETVARAVHAGVQALGLPHAGNSSCGSVVTASIGVSTAYPQFGGPRAAWLDLIADADKLLYEAKRTGRNKVVSPRSLVPGSAPWPDNEEARLAAVALYEKAGATRRCEALDRIAKLAATLTDAPIGLVSLVGRDEQRFAGNFGLDGVDGTGRDVSFCAHTILGNAPLVVPDTRRDARFRDNPLVTGRLAIRYYAGAPIVSESTGHRLGALCVMDRTGRPDTGEAQRAVLTDLAQMAALILEDRLAVHG